MNPAVSVVITSYNYGRYIGTTLESVRAQTVDDFEVIVLDDGSTDESLAVIGRFLDDERFRLVRQRHAGQSRAKNHGLELARGDFIAFLDADDVWRPHKLQRQLERFEAGPELGVVFTRRTLIDGEDRPLPVRDPQPPRGRVINELFRQNFICFSSAMIRAGVADHVGHFDERIGLAIDYDFWLRVARHYPVDVVDEPLVAYRMGHANLSRRQFDRLHVARLIMDRFQWHYGAAADLDRRAVVRAEAETLHHIGVVSRNFSRTTAIGWAIRALRSDLRHGPAWHGLLAAIVPAGLRRFVRRIRGRDDAWERQCQSAMNCPDAAL